MWFTAVPGPPPGPFYYLGAPTQQPTRPQPQGRGGLSEDLIYQWCLIQEKELNEILGQTQMDPELASDRTRSTDSITP